MAINEIESIKGIGPKAAKTLVDCGFNTIEKLAKTTADELSQLPGIGKSTAETMILNAKEVISSAKKPVAKAPVKKAAVKTAVKKVDKETIPKPPALKKKADGASVRPSVKKSETAAKPSVKKPAVKKPEIKKTVTKKPKAKPKTIAAEKKVISLAAVEAIEKAPAMRKIKSKTSKTSKTKSKIKKKVTLSKTYGIVHALVHDSAGKSKNNSVILYLHDLEMPISSYLGRKISITMLKSGKQITGTISKTHGKSSSRNNAVIVRFKKGVSPHIISARATLK
ncbi:MAG: helix-hairpin-helix domain-containing protein [Candidatus Heimdallarchaeaceae archaeon]